MTERAADRHDKGKMLYRTLGRTGETVSAIGLGGFHLGLVEDEAESIRIVHAAIDGGITFMDNSWDYHNGKSEVRLGKALKDKRSQVFLMTKIDAREKNAATAQINESLSRLQTDHLDLLQFHEVIRLTDAERIFGEGGGMESALEAKKQGKIRYIGFTGHKDPEIHLHMLRIALERGFVFDTVQMPLNLMDVHYHSFQKEVLPVLLQHNIGVLGMKPICAGKLLESKTVSAVDCLNYALSLPTSVVITGCDSMKVLQQALDVAANFQPLSEDAMRTLEQKTAAAAEAGKFEEYKTTMVHDSTTMHPEWLGAA